MISAASFFALAGRLRHLPRPSCVPSPRKQFASSGGLERGQKEIAKNTQEVAKGNIAFPLVNPFNKGAPLRLPLFILEKVGRKTHWIILWNGGVSASERCPDGSRQQGTVKLLGSSEIPKIEIIFQPAVAQTKINHGL
jgi:hypothetical protein